MFEKNLINYVKTQKLGACPSCGGKVELTEMKVPNRVNLIVSCLKCNKKKVLSLQKNGYKAQFLSVGIFYKER